MCGDENKNHSPTVNLHNLIPCNYKCGFCCAGFASAKRSHIPPTELHEILRQISAAPSPPEASRRKITVAGGEPLLSPTAIENIACAQSLGLFTSLVTNGSLLDEARILELGPILNWLTISIDSLDPDTNRRIGRAARGIPLDAEDYLARIRLAQALGIRVKINTVVNQANAGEDFIAFIRAARPLRWKLFQATRIAEENGTEFDRWAISETMFHEFAENWGSQKCFRTRIDYRARQKLDARRVQRRPREGVIPNFGVKD